MDELIFFQQWEVDAMLEHQLAVASGNPCSWEAWIAQQANSSSPAMVSFAADVLGSVVERKQEVNMSSQNAIVAAPASQNQDHVLAERKRREKLSERFIALSKMVPGLRKTDKISVLGDAIKYVRKLEEQVKGMEEEVARRRPAVEAAVLVKKSRPLAALELEDQETLVGLPEVEARMSSPDPDRTVLIRIHCEKRKGALVAAVAEVESIGLTIISTSVIPFTASYLDITIVAKAAGEDVSVSVEDIVRRLNQAFKLLPSLMKH